MKTIYFLTFFFFSAIISVFGQTGPANTASGDRTSIRSVVAQGGELRLLLHVVEAGTYEVNIYSTDGEVVYRETLQEQAGEVEQKIAFGGRGHGVYMVDVIGAGGQSSRQVMW
jgi:hypothetical protein